MRDVVKKMNNQFPETFFGNNILLATDMTKPSVCHSSAVKAVLFFSFRCVRHNKFFLKISTKVQVRLCFSLLSN